MIPKKNADKSEFKNLRNITPIVPAYLIGFDFSYRLKCYKNIYVGNFLN